MAVWTVTGVGQGGEAFRNCKIVAVPESGGGMTFLIFTPNGDLPIISSTDNPRTYRVSTRRADLETVPNPAIPRNPPRGYPTLAAYTRTAAAARGRKAARALAGRADRRRPRPKPPKKGGAKSRATQVVSQLSKKSPVNRRLRSHRANRLLKEQRQSSANAPLDAPPRGEPGDRAACPARPRFDNRRLTFHKGGTPERGTDFDTRGRDLALDEAARPRRALPAVCLFALLTGVLFAGLPFTPSESYAAGPEPLHAPPRHAAQATSQQEAAAPPALAPVERELKGGESHSYLISLAAGQFLHALVEQKGIDLEVVVYGPDGRQLSAADSPNDLWGPEPLVVLPRPRATTA